MLRVLEISSSPSTLWVSHIDTSEHLRGTIEYFLASHKEDALKAAREATAQDFSVPRRYGLLCEGQGLGDLARWRFDVLILHSHLETPVEAIAMCNRYLNPGALLFVRGLAQPASWLLPTMEALSGTALGSDSAQLQYEAWKEALREVGAVEELTLSSSDSKQVLLAARSPDALQPSSDESWRYVLIGNDPDALVMLAEGLQSHGSGNQVHFICIDDPSSEGWLDSFREIMCGCVNEKPFLRGVIYVSGAVADPLSDVPLVNLKGMWQIMQSPSFDNSLSLSLWIITSGLASGSASPEQGLVQGFAATMMMTKDGADSRWIDVATNDMYGRAGELVAVNLAERALAIDTDGTVMGRRYLKQRFEPHFMTVKPDGPLTYVAAAPYTEDQARDPQSKIIFRARTLSEPAADEVTVDIYASALRVHDSKTASTPVISHDFLVSEASGVITAVGHEVIDLHIGDRVLIWSPGAATNRLNAHYSRVFHCPGKISLTEGATLMFSLVTAYYALCERAKVRTGDKVLLLGANGGIDLAALMVCRHLGCRLFMAGPNLEKGKGAASGLAVEDAFYCEQEDWVEKLRSRTGGVDVMVNFLGPQFHQTLAKVMADNGRFIDVMRPESEQRAAYCPPLLRRNQSYMAVDIHHLAASDPFGFRELMEVVLSRVHSGHYRPLPSRCYPMGRLSEALNVLQADELQGRMIVANYQGEPGTTRVAFPVVAQRYRHELLDDGIYLIVRGGAGIGADILRQMVLTGARHFWITLPSDEALLTLEHYTELYNIPEALGCTIKGIPVNLTDSEDVNRLMSLMKEEDLPIRGIFYVAPPEPRGQETCNEAWLLHEASNDLAPELDVFVFVSSVANHIGGQPGLDRAVSGFLGALACYRHVQGLPASFYSIWQAQIPDTDAREGGINTSDELVVGRQVIRMLVSGQLQGFSLCLSPDVLIDVAPVEVSHLLREPVFFPPFSETIQGLVLPIVLGPEGVDSLDQSVYDVDTISSPELLFPPDTFTSYDVPPPTASPEPYTRSAAEAEPELARGLDDRQNVWGPKDAAEFMHSAFEEPSKPSEAGGRILLTGATGLFGAHLLRYLLKAGVPKIICLVRAGTRRSATARVLETMQRLRLMKDDFRGRIEAVPGDSTAHHLGLRPREYSSLVTAVSRVVHAGLPRTSSPGVDCGRCFSAGIMHVVAFARRSGASVHLLSSTWLDVEGVEHPIVPLLRQSESLLHFAARRYGVSCEAYRLPIATINTKGTYQGPCLATDLMKAMAATDQFPIDLSNVTLPVLPADEAAKSVVQLIMHSRAKSGKEGKELVLHSLTPSAVMQPVEDLAKIVEGVTGRKLRRSGPLLGLTQGLGSDAAARALSTILEGLPKWTRLLTGSSKSSGVVVRRWQEKRRAVAMRLRRWTEQRNDILRIEAHNGTANKLTSTGDRQDLHNVSKGDGDEEKKEIDGLLTVGQ